TKSSQVDIKPAQTAHLIRASVPARYTVRRPPPDKPPQPSFSESTSSLAASMDNAAWSSAKSTPGQVVPLLKSDLDMTCSCSAAHWLYSRMYFVSAWISSLSERSWFGIVGRPATSSYLTLRLPNVNVSCTKTT